MSLEIRLCEPDFISPVPSRPRQVPLPPKSMPRAPARFSPPTASAAHTTSAFPRPPSHQKTAPQGTVFSHLIIHSSTASAPDYSPESMPAPYRPGSASCIHSPSVSPESSTPPQRKSRSTAPHARHQVLLLPCGSKS